MELLTDEMAGRLGEEPPRTAMRRSIGLRGLVLHELARLLSRRRVPIVTLVLAALSGLWVATARSSLVAVSGRLMRPTAPMLAVGALDALSVLVLFSPLLLGGTLAEDRAGGLAVLLLGRSGSRTAWVGAKAIATLVATLALFGLLAAAACAAAAILAPWELHDFPSTVGVDAGWLATRPLLLVATAAVVLSIAATAVVGVSTLTGAIVTSPLVASVLPVLVMLGAAVALPAPLNPYARAAFLLGFFGWNSLAATGAYWLAVLACGWLTTLAIVSARSTP